MDLGFINEFDLLTLQDPCILLPILPILMLLDIQEALKAMDEEIDPEKKRMLMMRIREGSRKIKKMNRGISSNSSPISSTIIDRSRGRNETIIPLNKARTRAALLERRGRR